MRQPPGARTHTRLPDVELQEPGIYDESTSQMRTGTIFSRPYSGRYLALKLTTHEKRKKKKAIETCLHEIRTLIRVSDFYAIRAREISVTLNLYRILSINQLFACRKACGLVCENTRKVTDYKEM